MGKENKSYRIRTNVDHDSSVSFSVDNSVETLEILSLKIGQSNTYRLMGSNTGIIAGRVLANGGFGVPNVKVSVFVEYESSENMEQEILYHFASTRDLDYDGIRYNLLPVELGDECHQNIGTFPSKRILLDNNNWIEVFDKYYTFTTRTNESGDYLIYGVPTGNQTVHMDVDLSDIGILSQRPRDLIYKGYNANMFESPNKFKVDTNIDSLAQVITQDQTVYVYPFWGDTTDSNLNATVTRCDMNINYKFEPTCIFMGSVISDAGENSMTQKCIGAKKQGKMSEMITGEGKIEMIRKTPNGQIEQFSVNGDNNINSDGVWCYQIPMNLDYITTDEYGKTVITDNPNIGIATRARVRFRLSMSESPSDATARKRARFLIPNNPHLNEDYPNFSDSKEIDYEFGTKTRNENFRDLFWNNVYTVKSYIPRLQKSRLPNNLRHLGIKTVNHSGSNNPMPYNNLRIKFNFIYMFLCVLVKVLVTFVGFINSILTFIGNIFFEIGKVFFNLSKEFNFKIVGVYWFDGVCKLFAKYRGHGVRDADGISANDYLYEVYKDKENDTSNTGGVAAWFMNLFLAIGCGIWLKGLCETDDGVEINVSPGTYDRVKKILKDAGIETCNDRVDQLYNCIENQLAQDNEVTQFNFYNDWVNGVVYLPLWYRKIKKRRNGSISKDIWCSTDNTIIRERKYKKNLRMYATGVQKRKVSAPGNKNMGKITPLVNNEETAWAYADDESGAEIITFSKLNDDNCYGYQCHKYARTYFSVYKGIIYEKETSLGDKVYYYKPCDYDTATGNNDLVTLFATDLVLLGSLNDCDIHGIPQFFKCLESTTYNMPPDLLSETYDYINENNQTGIDEDDSNEIDLGSRKTEYTGADWGNLGVDQSNYNETVLSILGNDYMVAANENEYDNGGLFYGITCFTSYSKPKSDINLSRICELGVSLDESDEIPSVDSNSTDSGTDVLTPDGFISYDEIYNPDYRSMFATLNANFLRTKLNPETGLLEYDFNHMYLDNFDGSLRELMQAKTVNGNTEQSDFQEKANYIRNYNLEQSSDAYLNFRYGDYVKANGKKIYFYENNNTTGYPAIGVSINGKDRLPRYENSFYFYFGLNEGKTAIDKFNTDFFTDCTNKFAADIPYDMTYQGNSWCPKDVDDGFIAFDMNIDAPYTIKFTNIENNNVYYRTSINKEKFIFYGSEEMPEGYDKFTRYDLLFKSHDSTDESSTTTKDIMATGRYRIEVTDAYDNVYEDSLVFELPRIGFLCDVNPFNLRNADLMERFHGSTTAETYYNIANEGNFDGKEEDLEYSLYNIGDKIGVGEVYYEYVQTPTPPENSHYHKTRNDGTDAIDADGTQYYKHPARIKRDINGYVAISGVTEQDYSIKLEPIDENFFGNNYTGTSIIVHGSYELYSPGDQIEPHKVYYVYNSASDGYEQRVNGASIYTVTSDDEFYYLENTIIRNDSYYYDYYRENDRIHFSTPYYTYDSVNNRYEYHVWWHLYPHVVTAQEENDRTYWKRVTDYDNCGYLGHITDINDITTFYFGIPYANQRYRFTVTMLCCFDYAPYDNGTLIPNGQKYYTYDSVSGAYQPVTGEHQDFIVDSEHPAYYRTNYIYGGDTECEESNNQTVINVIVYEDIFKMYINGIDSELIANFKSGWNDAKLTDGKFKDINGDYSEFDESTIFGWNDLFNIGWYKDNYNYKHDLKPMNYTSSTVLNTWFKQLCQSISTSYAYNGIESTDHYTPYTWTDEYCYNAPMLDNDYEHFEIGHVIETGDIYYQGASFVQQRNYSDPIEIDSTNVNYYWYNNFYDYYLSGKVQQIVYSYSLAYVEYNADDTIHAGDTYYIIVGNDSYVLYDDGVTIHEGDVYYEYNSTTLVYEEYTATSDIVVPDDNNQYYYKVTTYDYASEVATSDIIVQDGDEYFYKKPLYDDNGNIVSENNISRGVTYYTDQAHTIQAVLGIDYIESAEYHTLSTQRKDVEIKYREYTDDEYLYNNDIYYTINSANQYIENTVVGYQNGVSVEDFKQNMGLNHIYYLLGTPEYEADYTVVLPNTPHNYTLPVVHEDNYGELTYLNHVEYIKYQVGDEINIGDIYYTLYGWYDYIEHEATTQITVQSGNNYYYGQVNPNIEYSDLDALPFVNFRNIVDDINNTINNRIDLVWTVAGTFRINDNETTMSLTVRTKANPVRFLICGTGEATTMASLYDYRPDKPILKARQYHTFAEIETTSYKELQMFSYITNGYVVDQYFETPTITFKLPTLTCTNKWFTQVDSSHEFVKNDVYYLYEDGNYVRHISTKTQTAGEIETDTHSNVYLLEKSQNEDPVYRPYSVSNGQKHPYYVSAINSAESIIPPSQNLVNFDDNGSNKDLTKTLPVHFYNKPLKGKFPIILSFLNNIPAYPLFNLGENAIYGNRYTIKQAIQLTESNFEYTDDTAAIRRRTLVYGNTTNELVYDDNAKLRNGDIYLTFDGTSYTEHTVVLDTTVYPNGITVSVYKDQQGISGDIYYNHRQDKYYPYTVIDNILLFGQTVAEIKNTYQTGFIPYPVGTTLSNGTTYYRYNDTKKEFSAHIAMNIIGYITTDGNQFKLVEDSQELQDTNLKFSNVYKQNMFAAYSMKDKIFNGQVVYKQKLNPENTEDSALIKIKLYDENIGAEGITVRDYLLSISPIIGEVNHKLYYMSHGNTIDTNITLISEWSNEYTVKHKEYFEYEGGAPLFIGDKIYDYESDDTYTEYRVYENCTTNNVKARGVQIQIPQPEWNPTHVVFGYGTFYTKQTLKPVGVYTEGSNAGNYNPSIYDNFRKKWVVREDSRYGLVYNNILVQTGGLIPGQESLCTFTEMSTTPTAVKLSTNDTLSASHGQFTRYTHIILYNDNDSGRYSLGADIGGMSYSQVEDLYPSIVIYGIYNTGQSGTGIRKSTLYYYGEPFKTDEINSTWRPIDVFMPGFMSGYLFNGNPIDSNSSNIVAELNGKQIKWDKRLKIMQDELDKVGNNFANNQDVYKNINVKRLIYTDYSADEHPKYGEYVFDGTNTDIDNDIINEYQYIEVPLADTDIIYTDGYGDEYRFTVLGTLTTLNDNPVLKYTENGRPMEDIKQGDTVIEEGSRTSWEDFMINRTFYTNDDGYVRHQSLYYIFDADITPYPLTYYYVNEISPYNSNLKYDSETKEFYFNEMPDIFIDIDHSKYISKSKSTDFNIVKYLRKKYGQQPTDTGDDIPWQVKYPLDKFFAIGVCDGHFSISPVMETQRIRLICNYPEFDNRTGSPIYLTALQTHKTKWIDGNETIVQDDIHYVEDLYYINNYRFTVRVSQMNFETGKFDGDLYTQVCSIREDTAEKCYIKVTDFDENPHLTYWATAIKIDLSSLGTDAIDDDGKLLTWQHRLIEDHSGCIRMTTEQTGEVYIEEFDTFEDMMDDYEHGAGLNVPSNEIWYRTTDHTTTTPNTSVWIANYLNPVADNIEKEEFSNSIEVLVDWGNIHIESNTYERGIGKIRFTGNTENDSSDITNIPFGAFFKNEKLVEVMLPSSDTFESIGNEAFRGCSNLKFVNIGGAKYIGTPNENFYSIPEEARYNYDGNTTHGSITWDESWPIQYWIVIGGAKYVRAGANVFRDCSNLTSVILNNVWVIGTSSFQHCTSLESIELPETLWCLGSAYRMIYNNQHGSNIWEYENGVFFDTALKYNESNNPLIIPVSLTGDRSYSAQNIVQEKYPNVTNLKSHFGSQAFLNTPDLSYVKFKSKYPTNYLFGDTSYETYGTYGTKFLGNYGYYDGIMVPRETGSDGYTTTRQRYLFVYDPTYIETYSGGFYNNYPFSGYSGDTWVEY